MSTLTSIGELVTPSVTCQSINNDDNTSNEKPWSRNIRSASDLASMGQVLDHSSSIGKLMTPWSHDAAIEKIHRLNRRPKTRVMHESTTVDEEEDVNNWNEGQVQKFGGLYPSPIFNLSNNHNGKGFDYGDFKGQNQGDGESSSPRNPPYSSVTDSCYTEFDNQNQEQTYAAPMVHSPKRNANAFSRYESLCKEMTNPQFQSSSDRPSLKDMLFFEEERNCNYTPLKRPLQEQEEYFAKPLSTAKPCNKRKLNVTYKLDSRSNEDYYMLPSSSNNQSNNALDDWYTGSAKNEEEYKPEFAQEFNTIPVVWPVYQAQKPPLFKDNFFYHDIKGDNKYVTEEDCDYACEKKVIIPVKEPSPKIKQLFKVGGIVVRNNVKDDTDYAKNINMDLQEEPRPYVAYGNSDFSNDEDHTSYERDTVYDDFTTSRPWEEDERAPWRISRGQNCGFNMDKSLKGAYDIKKTDTNQSKGSGVVHYLGSYVTRWF